MDNSKETAWNDLSHTNIYRDEERDEERNAKTKCDCAIQTMFLYIVLF